MEAFSSNELAFLSMLFFGVGLYGNLQFLGCFFCDIYIVYIYILYVYAIYRTVWAELAAMPTVLGHPRFNYYDPQWAKVDAGGYFNASYIVESLLLPISFFMHIACYIQKQNGK